MERKSTTAPFLPGWSGKAGPRQWGLEEEAVEGSETPHTIQLGVYGWRKGALGSSPDSAASKGLPPFPHLWTNSQIMKVAVGSPCRGHTLTGALQPRKARLLEKLIPKMTKGVVPEKVVTNKGSQTLGD